MNFIFGAAVNPAVNQAANDLVDREAYKGNIEKISWIVNLFDGYFIKVITFIAWLIISLAFLRNVLSGAYCTYPRLFDKLSAIKADMNSKKSSGGVGIFLWILSFIVPNIKPLTDAWEYNGNPKTYLTKSVIQGVIAVFIGTVIYNGLYRDVIGKGSEFGVHFVDKYIMSISVADVFDETLKEGKDFVPTYSDATKAGKFMKKFTLEVYNAILSYHGDEIKDANTKAVLGQEIEIFLDSQISEEIKEKMEKPEYKAAYQIYVIPKKPVIRTNDKLPEGMTELQFDKQISTFSVKSNKRANDDYYAYIVFRLQEKEIVSKGTISGVNIKGIIRSENGKTYLILPTGTKPTTTNLEVNGKVFQSATLAGYENYSVYAYNGTGINAGNATTNNTRYNGANLEGLELVNYTDATKTPEVQKVGSTNWLPSIPAEELIDNGSSTIIPTTIDDEGTPIEGESAIQQEFENGG